MTRYLLSTHTGAPQQDAPSPAPPSREVMERMMADIAALEQEMHDAGAWVFSARLDTATAARVVRDRDGETVVTDGPFVDSKEQLAGFYLIDADGPDEAQAWAARVAACVGNHIEVRELAAWADTPMDAPHAR